MGTAIHTDDGDFLVPFFEKKVGVRGAPSVYLALELVNGTVRIGVFET